MIYILVIWTAVAAQGSGGYNLKYDWRPIGEFHADHREQKYNAQQMCERAAQELGLKTDAYRCVRSR